MARGPGNRPQGWPFSDVALRPGSGTRTAGSPDGGGIGGALRDLAAASTRLIGEHLLLARIELREDVRVLGGQLARIALFAPLLMVGHALVCSALAVLLARWIGTAAALLVIGIPNLAAGAYGIRLAVRRVRPQQPMAQTLDALAGSAAVLDPHRQQADEKEVAR